MLELLTNDAIATLVAAVPSVLLAVFGYWRSTRLDQHAAASEGWQALIAHLQADNKALREQVTALKDTTALTHKNVAAAVEAGKVAGAAAGADAAAAGAAAGVAAQKARQDEGT